MSVYLDPLLPCLTSLAWKWNKSCHLTADTHEELHAFAKRIGLRREWFQLTHGTFAHYDLNPSRRAAAVKAGAKELDRRAAMEKWRELRLLPSKMAEMIPPPQSDPPPGRLL